MSDYYTRIKGIWEELDSMVDLPKVSVANEEIAEFLRAFGRMQEEQKLFQFLNGLDDVSKAQRSQILIMHPLPSVESACSILQQEELQREVLEEEQSFFESSALYGKGVPVSAGKDVEGRCGHCGHTGHSKEKCWQLIGYPKWHPKSKKFPQTMMFKENTKVLKGRTAAHVDSAKPKLTEGGLSLTSQQVEQLLKLLPLPSKASTEYEEDELEPSFAGNVYCSCASTKTTEWILDTGASDHMTPRYQNLHKVESCTEVMHINLPDGSMAQITHKGHVGLANKLLLKNGLCVPSFKFNLLSISKLTEDNNCIVLFYSKFCIIQDCATRQLKGFGRQKGGLYYLVDADIATLDTRFSSLPVEMVDKPLQINTSFTSAARLVDVFDKEHSVTSTCDLHNKDGYSLWHHRLGHAPLSILRHMDGISFVANDKVCVTCPMAKMFKLPFYQSNTTTTAVFELLHIDIWGPYRIPTYKNHRFFLTLVDDFSRATWTYLLQHKSQAINVLQQFCSYVQTQFAKTVNMVRSDNALEFTEGPCKDFFLAQGIIHQRSCVDRPQQNGIVERKHRHILEIARSLRF